MNTPIVSFYYSNFLVFRDYINGVIHFYYILEIVIYSRYIPGWILKASYLLLNISS